MLRQASFNQVTGEIPDTILAFFNDRSQGGKAAPLQIESQISGQLIKILLSGVRLRVMIDALDECDEPMDLLGSLAEVYKAVPGALEILITSRNKVRVKDIGEFLECQEINLKSSISNTDMRNFINLEVRGAEKHARLLKGSRPDLEKKLIDVLNKKANGMLVSRSNVPLPVC